MLKRLLAPIFVLTFILFSIQFAKAAEIQEGKVEKLLSISTKGIIEGVSYCQEDGYLYFCEIEAGWISRVNLEGEYERFYNIGAPRDKMGPNGTLYDKRRKKLLIAHRHWGIVALDLKNKSLETIVDNYEGKRFIGPNDLCLDSNDNIYLTDAWGTSIDNPTGAVYRIDADNGDITQLFSHLAFPNGILISLDEQHIFVTEHCANRLLMADLYDGGKSTIFLHAMTYFNGGVGPDGMNMDVKGNLYIAQYGAAKVYIVEPKFGEIVDIIEIPDPKAIATDKVCFGGPDNKILFISVGGEVNEIWKVRISIPGLAR